MISAFSGYPMSLMHSSRDPKTFFFNKTFIKNGSHDTIYTFKNYFATVFSVFSFLKNKRYPNKPLLSPQQFSTHIKCCHYYHSNTSSTLPQPSSPP